MNFYWLARSYHETERVQYFCAGEIVATIKNLFLAEGQEPLTPWDFVPNGKPDTDDIEEDDDDAEGASQRMQAWAIAWNANLARQKELAN